MCANQASLAGLTLPPPSHPDQKSKCMATKKFPARSLQFWFRRQVSPTSLSFRGVLFWVKGSHSPPSCSSSSARPPSDCSRALAAANLRQFGVFILFFLFGHSTEILSATELLMACQEMENAMSARGLSSLAHGASAPHQKPMKSAKADEPRHKYRPRQAGELLTVATFALLKNFACLREAVLQALASTSKETARHDVKYVCLLRTVDITQ